MPRFIAGCAALVCCLSAPAAPVPKDAGRPSIYFPTTVGATWVYEKPSGEDEVVAVSGVEKNGDELIVSRTGADGNNSRYTKMIVSTRGLRQERELADGKVAWLLKSNAKAGHSWEVPDRGTRTVHGPEDVQVPAGKFKALRVVWEHDGGTLTSWYAPGVGEIKRVEKRGGQDVVTRNLKSFKLKDQK